MLHCIKAGCTPVPTATIGRQEAQKTTSMHLLTIAMFVLYRQRWMKAGWRQFLDTLTTRVSSCTKCQISMLSFKMFTGLISKSSTILSSSWPCCKSMHLNKFALMLNLLSSSNQHTTLSSSCRTVHRSSTCLLHHACHCWSSGCRVTECQGIASK